MAQIIERIKTFPTVQLSHFFLIAIKSYTHFCKRVYEEFCQILDLKESVNL